MRINAQPADGSEDEEGNSKLKRESRERREQRAFKEIMENE